jgi:hypothetical protein
MRLITSIILIVIFASLESKSQTIQRTELLGRPTANSITLLFTFSDSVEISIQYGTASGVYTNQTVWQTYAGNIPIEIIISGLNANTKYYYRVNYRHPNTSGFKSRPEYTFHTQRLPGSPFSFIVQADPHLDNQSDTSLYRLCLQNQLADSPDFMIDLGDFLMTDKLKNSSNVIPRDTIPYRCNLLRSYYETSGHSLPLFIALGNHEGESGWNLNGTPNNIAVWGTQERQKYFLNPSPNSFYKGDTVHHDYVGQRENYYAWQWGDAMFIVLDPYWYTSPKPDSLHGWRWTLGQIQYNWLKSTLENSTATFKFVFAHQIIGGDPDGRGGVEFANLYEWGGDNLDGTYGFAINRPGWAKPIKELLSEHRVNIFFHGHDHLFAKQEKDCMIYQETPQPSHPNFSSVNYAADYGYKNGQILPQSGHLRVTVDSNEVKVDYIRAYLPKNETTTRHNKDISATYFIRSINCYDSLSTGVPVLWNSNYSDELVYPNPFSKETKIEFSLSKPEKIDLSIFNENGQLVRKLITESIVPEGKYQVIWDGKNFSGIEQANGVYWYSIQSESNRNNSGKIILIK